MPIFKKLIGIADFVDKNTGLAENIDKPYLILSVPYDSIPDPESGSYLDGNFKAIRGRRNAFNYIKDELSIYGINILKSFILSGNIAFGNEVSVYTFLRQCVEKFKYAEPDFIEEMDQALIDLSDGKLTKDKIYNSFISELSSKAHD